MTDNVVTQADREAAADWMSTKNYDWGYCGDVRAGRAENDLVQAFARHRLAAIREGAAVPAGGGETLTTLVQGE